MTKWKEYKLGEIGEVITGNTPSKKNPEQWGDIMPFVTPTDFDVYIKNISGSIRYLSKEGISAFHKKVLPADSVIVTCIGSQMGKVALNKKECVTNQQINSIIPHKEFNSDFIYYVISSMQDYLRNLATGGSTMPIVNKSTFENIIIKAPDYATQTAIAEILSSLDDKIELNNKINKELENLAQTIFKQWFIDFEFPANLADPALSGVEGYKSSGGEMVDSELGEIPKGWELKKLGELVKKSNTGADAIKRAPIVNEDTGVRCVRVGDMTNKRPFDEWGFCKITPEDYKRYKLDINDIVVTRTATLGINTIIRNEIKGVYNNGLIRLKMDENKIIPLLAYCFFQSDAYKIWIERISGDSSTRPNMQINYLLDFPMYQCPISIQKKFIEQASVIFENLENNILENKELIQLRDTLLPKLISGELEVSDALTQTIA